MLQKISIFFHQSIDRLLNQRIDFDELEIARADTLRVLAITMDQDQRQNIELVYSKAEAGYLDGFQDPEFISELPKMYIPNPVSYTHLRAHETVLDLVCRLLLEKKKTNLHAGIS